MGFDPGVFGRFDLAALVQPHLKIFVCLFVCLQGRWEVLEGGVVEQSRNKRTTAIGAAAAVKCLVRQCEQKQLQQQKYPEHQRVEQQGCSVGTVNQHSYIRILKLRITDSFAASMPTE